MTFIIFAVFLYLSSLTRSPPFPIIAPVNSDKTMVIP